MSISNGAEKYEIIVKDNPQETCLSREVIKRLGINSDNFASGKQCLTFEQLVQGGSYSWDIGVFRLDFSVPQAWVEELESGDVPPKTGSGVFKTCVLYLLLCESVLQRL
ncbi:FimD/PapC N-terminal domain-containing protein [Shigella flexneri]